VAQQWVLRVVIRPMEDGPGYLAVCPDLQGCHAEGATPGAALDTVRAVAAALLALRQEDGLLLPTGSPPAADALVDAAVRVTLA
jgi:predicted RNase H-like HicB family nuclease